MIVVNKNSMTAAPAITKIAHTDFTKDLDITGDELFALLELAVA